MKSGHRSQMGREHRMEMPMRTPPGDPAQGSRRTRLRMLAPESPLSSHCLPQRQDGSWATAASQPLCKLF